MGVEFINEDGVINRHKTADILQRNRLDGKMLFNKDDAINIVLLETNKKNLQLSAKRSTSERIL